MNPRVLLITSIYPPQVGGPAIFTSRFSNWLFEKKYEVQIVTYTTTKTTYHKNISYMKGSKTISFQRKLKYKAEKTPLNQSKCT